MVFQTLFSLLNRKKRTGSWIKIWGNNSHLMCNQPFYRVFEVWIEWARIWTIKQHHLSSGNSKTFWWSRLMRESGLLLSIFFFSYQAHLHISDYLLSSVTLGCALFLSKLGFSIFVNVLLYPSLNQLFSDLCFSQPAGQKVSGDITLCYAPRWYTHR